MLSHGHVSDIMSGKERETRENKEKCEDKKAKGMRNGVTVHYLTRCVESEQTCL